MNEFEKQDTYQASEVERMKAAYEHCQLNRREFMQGLMAVGLTATTAAAILTGSRDVRAMTPKKGGKIKVAFTQHGPTDTLDPTLVTDSISYARGRAHQNRLVQFNDDITVRGDLAESFEVNSDATEFTFHLRKDVTFHDGKDFTADDVVYTMNRHLGEDSVSKAKTLVGMISEWKKLDKHTVKAVLSNPNADLLPILATFHFSIVQDGADEIPNHFQKVNGTGPFTVEEFQPGVRSISKRNPNYFRDGPNMDEIEMFGIGDVVARINALAAGDIDMAQKPDSKAFKQVEAAEGINLLSVVSGGYVDFVLMQDRAPGNNPDFVMAIKLLQNRVRMVRSLMKGHGGLGNDHPVGPRLRSGPLRDVSAAGVRSGPGQVPFEEIRYHRSPDPWQRRYFGRHGFGPHVAGGREKAGPQYRFKESAVRRLLGQHLDADTVSSVQLERSPDRVCHDGAGVRTGRAMERIAVEERAHGSAAQFRTGRDRPGQAQRDVVRHARAHQ